MDAYPLFHDEPLPPHQAHSPTSRAAARSIVESAELCREKVLRYFFERGQIGATDEEASRDLGMDPSTCRARRIELTLPKYGRCVLRDSGSTRQTRSGRVATVWILNQ